MRISDWSSDVCSSDLPTALIEHDIRDQKGNLIAAAGQRINPLDFVAIRQDLVFIDGDDRGELDWALARYADPAAKIIFVKGSPIDQMTARKRRFYFNQEGRLTGTFGIRHTQLGRASCRESVCLSV